MADNTNILISHKKADELFKYRFTDRHIEMCKNISPTINIFQAELVKAEHHLTDTDIIITWSFP